MGRRKNNPDLVDELIEGLWSMDNDEFEEKYSSLSASDQGKVSSAIDNMEDDYFSSDDDDEDESLSVYDAAEIWLSYGKDEEHMFGYSREELEEALR